MFKLPVKTEKKCGRCKKRASLIVVINNRRRSFCVSCAGMYFARARGWRPAETARTQMVKVCYQGDIGNYWWNRD